MPDVSLVDSVITDLFSWDTIPDLGSDRLPLLLIWGEDIKVGVSMPENAPATPKRIVTPAIA